MKLEKKFFEIIKYEKEYSYQMKEYYDEIIKELKDGNFIYKKKIRKAPNIFLSIFIMK